jgi:pimeloyl-ACP methyl ester carboxylesterase
MIRLSRRRLGQLAIGTSLCLAGRAMAAPEAINEAGFVKIGGIEQWIAIQGRDRADPAILFLHGGPGEAQSPFLDQFKPWEDDFTVVNWDQRGAGKTHEKNGEATPDVSLERLTDDAIALTENVLRKLGKKKLVLVGQSAGTVLGLKVALQRPDLFYTFVGTGKLVSVMRAAEWQERRSNVQATHDAAELKALHKWAIMSPPDQPYINLQIEFMGSPEHPKPRAATWLTGYYFEASKLGKEVEVFDATTSALNLAVPYILIQGREDRITPSVPAKAYFDKVQSTGKVFVPIKGGHYACFTNSGDFVAALQKYVLPLVR